MFNTGLPPLDRQGLFPSHGSILDPLQASAAGPSTSSSFSIFNRNLPVSAGDTSSFKLMTSTHQPSTPIPMPIPIPRPIPPTVNLANESDEEVLVDDFDGQCCRTYPDNHSKIIKWRAQRNERRSSKNNSLTVVTAISASVTTTTVAKSTSSQSTGLVSRKSRDVGKSHDGPSASGVFYWFFLQNISKEK
jgi:hypothetical protein